MKIIRNSAVVALAVLAVACSKEENYTPAPKDGKPVNFRMTVAGMGTRTVTEADGSNRSVSWREGDAVGIFVNDEASACKYGYSAAEGWTSASAIFARPDESYSFYSYYPYDSEIVTAASATSVEASVLANQNDRYDSNSGFDLSDVLLASRENVTGEALENVELQYSHAFAMVEVLVSGTLVVAAPESVTLGNVVRTAAIDLKTKAVALKAGAAAGTVKMYKVEPVAEGAKGYLYRAIVPAQSVAAGEVLLEVALAGNSYRFRSSVAVPYEAGKYRRIEAVIGNEEGGISLKFPAGSADAWTPSAGLPDGGGEEVPVDLIGIKIAGLTSDTFRQVGNAATYLHDPANANYINESCWAMSTYTNESISAEIIENDGANVIRLYSEAGVAFSWFKSGIRYHHVGEFKPGYYRLGINLKKAGASEGLGVYIRTSKTTEHPFNNGIFFSVPGANDSYTARNFIGVKNTDWETKNVYFDFNQAFEDVTFTTANGKTLYDMSSDAEAYDWFDLAIMPNSGGQQEFFISNVELVKISKEEYDSRK